MLKRLSNIFIFSAVALFLVCMLLPVKTLAFTSEDGITAPDELLVRVGYYGGTYSEKATISVAEMEQMDVVEHHYTYINRVGNVVEQYARGVKLTDVLKYAGIDVDSVNTLHFSTLDTSDDYFVSVKISDVTRSRYYYPNLRANWDYENDCVTDEAAAMEGGEKVPTILAIDQYWSVDKKVVPDASMITPDSRFRLSYGQTDVSSITSYESAKWIYAVDVQLYGYPPDDITITGAELQELTIGSKLKLEANVTGEGDVVKKVTWTSSDPTVVKVASDGRITVVGEGEATITATTVNGLTASVTIRGVAEATATPSPTPSAEGSPVPSGTGGGGSPTASGSPTGSAAPAPTGSSAPKPTTSATPKASSSPKPSASTAPNPTASSTPTSSVTPTPTASQSVIASAAPIQPSAPPPVNMAGYREITVAGTPGDGAEIEQTREESPSFGSTALREIEVDKTAQLFAGCGAGVLMLAGILLRVLQYFKEI